MGLGANTEFGLRTKERDRPLLCSCHFLQLTFMAYIYLYSVQLNIHSCAHSCFQVRSFFTSLFVDHVPGNYVLSHEVCTIIIPILQMWKPR